MRVLLDTHIALWAITDSARLPPRARAIVAAPENAIYASVACLWEIAIKHALKRKGAGAMPISAQTAHNYFLAAGYGLLAVTPQHVIGVEALPALHTDPFDRLMVAQALCEPLHFLTQDEDLAGYGEMVTVV